MEVINAILLEILGFTFIIFGVYIYFKYFKLFLRHVKTKNYLREGISIRNLFLTSMGIINFARGLSLCFISISRYNMEKISSIFSDFFKEFVTLSFATIFSFVLLMILIFSQIKSSKIITYIFIVAILCSYFIFFIYGIIMISFHYDDNNYDFIEQSDNLPFSIIYLLFGVFTLIIGFNFLNQIQNIDSPFHFTHNQGKLLNKV